MCKGCGRNRKRGKKVDRTAAIRKRIKAIKIAEEKLINLKKKET